MFIKVIQQQKVIQQGQSLFSYHIHGSQNTSNLTKKKKKNSATDFVSYEAERWFLFLFLFVFVHCFHSLSNIYCHWDVPSNPYQCRLAIIKQFLVSVPIWYLTVGFLVFPGGIKWEYWPVGYVLRKSYAKYNMHE